MALEGQRRLADPGSRLAYRYDAIVIGSGYGGSLVAARLAHAGASVCMLDYLACGHDSGSGRLVLRDPAGRVTISWPGVGAEPAFALITKEMEALSRERAGH